MLKTFKYKQNTSCKKHRNAFKKSSQTFSFQHLKPKNVDECLIKLFFMMRT